MQCYICVTYMMFLCAALPRKPPLRPQEQRSLFQDVINSLKIPTKILNEDPSNNENNIARNDYAYSYRQESDELHSQNDADFIPRRNDRIEMASLRYRIPKSLNDTEPALFERTDHSIGMSGKEEIIVYITTKEPRYTTPNPSRRTTPNRLKPSNQKNKINNKNKNSDGTDEDSDIDEADASQVVDRLPITQYLFNMTGQSQIGNRESQIVVKPSVVLNFRGTISHKDSDIKLTGRKDDSNMTVIETTPQNVFNIKQEINLDRAITDAGGIRGLKQEAVKTRIEDSSNEDDQVDTSSKMMEGFRNFTDHFITSLQEAEVNKANVTHGCFLSTGAVKIAGRQYDKFGFCLVMTDEASSS